MAHVNPLKQAIIPSTRILEPQSAPPHHINEVYTATHFPIQSCLPLPPPENLLNQLPNVPPMLFELLL